MESGLASTNDDAASRAVLPRTAPSRVSTGGPRTRSRRVRPSRPSPLLADNNPPRAATRRTKRLRRPTGDMSSNHLDSPIRRRLQEGSLGTHLPRGESRLAPSTKTRVASHLPSATRSQRWRYDRRAIGRGHLFKTTELATASCRGSQVQPASTSRQSDPRVHRGYERRCSRRQSPCTLVFPYCPRPRLVSCRLALRASRPASFAFR